MGKGANTAESLIEIGFEFADFRVTGLNNLLHNPGADTPVGVKNDPFIWRSI